MNNKNVEVEIGNKHLLKNLDKQSDAHSNHISVRW